MNTNTNEMNMNEMEQVNGGVKHHHYQNTMKKWSSNDVVSYAKAISNGACILGKVAYNWFTGLFD